MLLFWWVKQAFTNFVHGYDHACNVYANNTADSQKYGNFEDGGNNKLKYVRIFLDFIK